MPTSVPDSLKVEMMKLVSPLRLGLGSLAVMASVYASAVEPSASARLFVYEAERVEEPMEARLVEAVLRSTRMSMEAEGRSAEEINASLEVIRRTATQQRITRSEVRALVRPAERSLAVRSTVTERRLGAEVQTGGRQSSYAEVVTPSAVGLFMGSSAPFQFEEGRVWDRGEAPSAEGTENLSHSLGTPLGPWIASGQDPAFLPFEASAREQFASLRGGLNAILVYRGTRYLVYSDSEGVNRVDVTDSNNVVVLTIRLSNFQQVEGRRVAQEVVLRRFQPERLTSEYRLTLRSVAVGDQIPEADRFLLPVGLEVSDEREGGAGRFTSTGEIPNR